MPGAGHTAGGGGAGGEIGQRQHAPSGVEQGQGQHGPIREAQQFVSLEIFLIFGHNIPPPK